MLDRGTAYVKGYRQETSLLWVTGHLLCIYNIYGIYIHIHSIYLHTYTHTPRISCIHSIHMRYTYNMYIKDMWQDMR